MRLVLRSALAIGGLSLAGCSSSDASNPSSGGGTGGALADARPQASGGTSGASGAGGTSGASGAGGSDRGGVDGGAGASDGGGGKRVDGGSADAGSPTKSGYVGVVSQGTAVATVFVNAVIAGFSDGPGSSYARGCARQVVGACQVLSCHYADGGAETPPTGAPQSAGTVTVTGTTPKFTLDYDAGTKLYGAVPAVPGDRPLFAGGATIGFAAAGAVVPAFADSLVAPTPINVTSPALTGGALSIDSGKDLVFVWTGASVGRIAFNVRTATSNASGTTANSFVSCQFDASALTGTIPTALLRKLDKTDATTTALLTTDLSNTKEKVVGDYSIHLAVGSLATQADGKTPYKASQVTIF